MKPEKASKEKHQPFDKDLDALVDCIRFSNDPQERKRALSELRRLGLVDELDNAPATKTEPVVSPPQPKPKKVARAIFTIVAVFTGLCFIMLCILLLAW